VSFSAEGMRGENGQLTRFVRAHRGIFGPNFVLKAIEWGLAKDRRAYTWLGFDEAVVVKPEEEEKHGHGVTTTNGAATNGHAHGQALARQLATGSAKRRHVPSPSLPTPPDSPSPGLVAPDIGTSGRASVVKSTHARIAAHSYTPLTIARDALHLFASMRGIGYAFGPPIRSLAPSPPRDHLAFLRCAVYRSIKAHLISISCFLIIIHRQTLVPTLLHQYLLPFLSLAQVQPLANVLAYLSVGLSLQSDMQVGSDNQSIICLLLSHLPLPAAIRPTFDSREWAPMFDRPFQPESVTVFWSQQWHPLFRKPFTMVGYEPMVMVVGKLGGKKAGRAAGAVIVFMLSAWMHDQGKLLTFTSSSRSDSLSSPAFWSARYGLDPSILPPLSFIERYGAWIFFLWQAIAVSLESLFTGLTGRRVRGPIARIWSYACIVGVGCLAGKSWFVRSLVFLFWWRRTRADEVSALTLRIALGFVKDLPTIEHWGWQRFVLPTAAIAPPPLYVV
jgi:hypothetical protein